MNSEAKFFMGVVVVTIAALVGAIYLFSRPPAAVDPQILVPAEAWATGSATPKVTLVEFSDFQCPACGAAYPTVKQITEQYKDQLKFVYRHFPLAQHQQAQKAAEAAEAAGVQGKFWEMHDLLFENQASLSAELMIDLAKQLHLDETKFTKELNDGIYSSRVQKDQTAAFSLGVNSTPTFYLNGKKLSLFSFADLKTEIEKALQ